MGSIPSWSQIFSGIFSLNKKISKKISLPDSVGYLCPRISPAATKPTTILGHGQFHLVNCLWLRKNSPTQGQRPSFWLNHSIQWGLPGLQSLHAHTKYIAGVQLCVGVGLHPNWCSLCPCKRYDEGEGLCRFEPCCEGGHPACAPPVCTF